MSLISQVLLVFFYRYMLYLSISIFNRLVPSVLSVFVYRYVVSLSLSLSFYACIWFLMYLHFVGLCLSLYVGSLSLSLSHVLSVFFSK